MGAPDNPKIFHIVHADHLESIIRDGGLFSDAIMSSKGKGAGTAIGMQHIKDRRMKTPVGSAGGGMVGEYVPFYFCPRSIMLYIIYKGNHPNTTYHGGQREVIHLVSNVNDTVNWVATQHKDWVFSDTNAGAGYVQFFYDKSELGKLRWDLIRRADFRPQEVKLAKQAEFLVRDSFTWELITDIVVYDEDIKQRIESLLAYANHKPIVRVYKEWYY